MGQQQATTSCRTRQRRTRPTRKMGSFMSMLQALLHNKQRYAGSLQVIMRWSTEPNDDRMNPDMAGRCNNLTGGSQPLAITPGSEVAKASESLQARLDASEQGQRRTSAVPILLGASPTEHELTMIRGNFQMDIQVGRASCHHRRHSRGRVLRQGQAQQEQQLQERHELRLQLHRRPGLQRHAGSTASAFFRARLVLLFLRIPHSGGGSSRKPERVAGGRCILEAANIRLRGGLEESKGERANNEKFMAALSTIQAALSNDEPGRVKGNVDFGMSAVGNGGCQHMADIHPHEDG